MRHIMVDIETLGNDSHSIMTSIAAIAFDPYTGKEYGVFDKDITIESCTDVGLKITGSTVRWWLEQNEEARMRIAKPKDPLPLREVLLDLDKFLREHEIMAGKGKYNFKIWGNSPRFDQGIIEDGYDACGLPRAWDFRDEMCLRTLNTLRPQHRKEARKKMERVYHDPVVDCRFQISYLVPIWNEFMPR